MPQIHPTALVHDSARLAHDAIIGPYAIIEDHVVLESGCRVEAHAQILARTIIGEQCVIGRAAIVGGDPQSLSFDPAIPSQVVLGKGNRLREHVTIHRSMYEGKATVIGEDNFLMAGSHVGHDTIMGNRNVLANCVLLGGHVTVGNNVFLGGGSVFHQFIRVGDGSITQGVSGFSMDLPPFVVGASINQVRGLNVIGLKRAGFDTPTRQAIKRAFDLLYRSGKNYRQAIEAARQQTWPEPAERFIAFFESRGPKGVASLARQGSESLRPDER